MQEPKSSVSFYKPASYKFGMGTQKASMASLTTMNTNPPSAKLPKTTKAGHHRYVFKRVNKLKYNN